MFQKKAFKLIKFINLLLEHLNEQRVLTPKFFLGFKYVTPSTCILSNNICENLWY